jgi:hypothetical protein
MEGRPRVRGWPIRRIALIAFWSFVIVALSALVNLIPGFADDALSHVQEIATNDVRLWMFVMEALVAAPVVETALLALPVIWLRHHRVHDAILIVLSAGLLSLIHFSYGSQGFAVFPAFLVFAYSYVVRSAPPHRDGYQLTVLIHLITNVVPVTGLLMYRYFPDS